MLTSSDGPLCDRYDLAMLDLDGVVYVGGEAVPGAAEHLRDARGRGMRTAFVTNNASRPARTVAAHLRDLDVDADDGDVVTSAQAAARVLLDRLGDGTTVVVCGGEGLHESVEAVGLRAVGVEDDAAAGVDAVVTGYGPDVRWREVMQVAVRVRDGAWWVASNTDGTIPTPYGTAPGHGVLVDTLRRFSGFDPVVAGKPARPLLEETIRRTGGERPLMVGDRLDTDIEGGRALDLDTLLVLTGVTGVDELVAAAPETRPTYLHHDLAGLLVDHPEPTRDDDGAWRCGGWSARVDDDGVVRLDERDGEADPTDWWRALAAASWEHLDDTGSAVDTSALEVPRPDAGAR